jgi:SAM-dependent methyltransferase
MSKHAQFDEYADNYDTALDRGISLSGEDKDYFARRRLEWLRECLRGLAERPRRVMDYGCGSGTATPFLFDVLGASFALGVDMSAKSVDAARRQHGSDRAQFQPLDQYQPSPTSDIVYCNGVFHHIPPPQRAAAVSCIWNSLLPGGLFALWENNPWNPGTRIVMSRIPFDRDAITLTARSARRLLRAGGFEVLRTDYLFIFPRALQRLRGFEPRLASLPFGAQYQVLSRKPL